MNWHGIFIGIVLIGAGVGGWFVLPTLKPWPRPGPVRLAPLVYRFYGLIALAVAFKSGAVLGIVLGSLVGLPLLLAPNFFVRAFLISGSRERRWMARGFSIGAVAAGTAEVIASILGK